LGIDEEWDESLQNPRIENEKDIGMRFI